MPMRALPRRPILYPYLRGFVASARPSDDDHTPAQPRNPMPLNTPSPHNLRINRAPVLTLWAATVAERLGFSHEEALTLGRAMAGLNAYSKGVSLGLFTPAPKEVREKRAKLRPKDTITVDLLHRAVPAVHTETGVRALSGAKPIDPEAVERYLASKFGADYDVASEVMLALARSRPPAVLAREAYALYEQFRPKVAPGVRGWGAAGTLDLEAIRRLAKRE